MPTQEDALLRKTLQRMADDAHAEPGLGRDLAERALHRAARRRTARFATAGVAAAAVAVVVIAPLALRGTARGSGGSATSVAATSHQRTPRPTKPAERKITPPPVDQLPANTPAQLAIVHACMQGDPGIPGQHAPKPGQPDTGMAGPGTHVADFRLLATSKKDAKGQAVMLGSKVAVRICSLDPSGKPSPGDRIPHQTANLWNSATPLSSLPNNVIIDDAGGGVLSVKEQSMAQAGKAGWEMHLAGRTAPGVARLTFTAPGLRTLEAAVTDNFFVVRNTGQGFGLPELNARVTATVKLYTADGTLLTSITMDLDQALFQKY